MPQTHENLGAAERVVAQLTTYSDHAYHGRIGAVFQDPRQPCGVRWEPVTYAAENNEKVVYRLEKVGKTNRKVRLGVLQPNGKIVEGRTEVAEFREAGLFPEVVAWMYRQIAEVWKLDNEFAARWASYQFRQEHRDLKVVLAAFMLVQSRKGDPVLDNGKLAFRDEDFRDVGEAMMLLYDKQQKGLDPKLILRIREVLALPEIAKINRELGFGRSQRKPFLGRWTKATEKWLTYREENPKLLDGLVKAGFASTVKAMCQHVGFKPASPAFFSTLRWKQVQAEDGRRALAIGETVAAAESWNDLTEEQICEKIVKDKPNWKRVVGLLPKKIGVTRAIVAAAIEAGSMSNKDLIIFTPTLEELGLLQVQDVRERWEKAVKEADDMRAAHIAQRVKHKDTQDKLAEAADNAVKKAVEEVAKDLEVYVMVDISGSMEGAIQAAKAHIAKFLQAFPPDQLHVSVFNTAGREIRIQHASAAGVENAFRGITAGGGTDYGAGVRALQHHKPKAGRDVLFFFVGDEEASSFEAAVRSSGLNPVAFGFVKTVATAGAAGWRAQQNYNAVAVRETANRLGLPCFMVDEATFADASAVPRVLRNLIAATPVTAPTAAQPVKRKTLVDTILETQLLAKPHWAA